MITKYSLVVSNEKAKDNELESIETALKDSVDQLVMAVKVSLLAGCGKALGSHILQLAKLLIGGVDHLKCNKGDIHADTGKVWHLVEQLQVIPKSNKIAVKREWMMVRLL